MSDEKRRTISEQADEIRRELDSLIGDDERLDVESDPSDLPVEHRPAALARPTNYADLKDKATNKAK